MTLRKRLALGLALALALHAIVLVLLEDVRVHEVTAPSTHIQIALLPLSPPSSPVAPTNAPPPPMVRPVSPAVEPAPREDDNDDSDDASDDENAHDRAASASDDASEPAAASSVVAAGENPGAAAGDNRLGPRADTAADAIGDLAGTIKGSNAGPAPSMATLEGASDIKVVGPESDNQRAGRVALGNLKRDIAEHDVARGLANDWFRRRKAEVERSWHPQDRELVDGGKEVRAEQLLLRTIFNPLLWNEANEKIAGDASRVADSFSGDRASAIVEMMLPKHGKDESDSERRSRMWSTYETHRSAFNTNAGLEVIVHHRADGSVEAIEVAERSGHPMLDDGAVDAVARAFNQLGVDDKLPEMISRGQPFVSRWSLNASWEVNVPKCSYMQSGSNAAGVMAGGGTPAVGCGTSFGNDGVDVPFTVKKLTHVELISVQSL